MELIKRIINTVIALFICALGLTMMSKSTLGMSPWWTFTYGLSIKTGISVGYMVQGLSLLLILGAYVLGKKPGIATILDMFLVGTFINMFQDIGLLDFDFGQVSQYILAVLGFLLFCLGLCLTIRNNLGAGPKESFTIAVVKKINIKFSKVKLAFETSIFLLGVVLGAPFGIGTVVTALFTGTVMDYLFKRMKYDIKTAS